MKLTKGAHRSRGPEERATSRSAPEETDKVALTAAEYERLCRVACAFPASPVAGETPEEAYWWVICLTVHQHLGAELRYEPVAGLGRGAAYRQTLARLVRQRQAEPFDWLEIARRHVASALTTATHAAEEVAKK